MAIPRPKILTRITVPTGGWAVEVDLSTLAAGQYMVNVSTTIPAGNYYISWDKQSDDLIDKFEDVLTTAIRAAGAPFGSSEVFVYIDSDHKINITFEDAFTGDNNDIKLDWPNMSEIGQAFGFRTLVADTSTADDNPTFTSDYHHAYGWYADEDGLLADDMPEDVDNPRVAQSRSISGHVKTQYFGSIYTNSISLQFLTREKTYSNEIGYATYSVHPYNTNEPLECWFREAKQGVPFRIYQYNHIDTTLAAERGTTTSNSTTQLVDATKSWTTEPYKWDGRLLYIPNFSVSNGKPCRWYINSHGTTALNVTGHPSGVLFNSYTSPNTYYIFDQTYETYVLDIDSMKKFAPDEIPKIDRYNITIPLWKYVS